MPNPVKAAKGIASLFDKTEDPTMLAIEKLQRLKKYGRAPYVGSPKIQGDSTRNYEWIFQHLHKGDDQKSIHLLAKIIKSANPDIEDMAALTYAQNTIMSLRAAQKNPVSLKEKRFYDQRANEINREIKDIIELAKETDYKRGLSDKPYVLGAALAPALAKMAEATMVPEPSFGEKTGEFLMDWLQPLPRSWGQADPKMRVD